MATATPHQIRRLEMALGAASQLVSDLLEVTKESENGLLVELITPLVTQGQEISDKIRRYHLLVSEESQTN